MIYGIFKVGVFKVEHLVGANIHTKYIISDSYSRAELTVMKLRLKLEKLSLDLNRTVEINSGGVFGAPLINLCMYMSGLLKGGSEKGEALRMVADQSPKESYLINTVADTMYQGGKTMHDAMVENHFTKDEIFLTAVHAGEESSTLPSVLRTYAVTTKRVARVFSDAWKKNIKSLSYLLFIPIALLIVKFIGEDSVTSLASSMQIDPPKIAQIVLLLPDYGMNLLFFLLASMVGYLVFIINQSVDSGSRYEKKFTWARIKGVLLDMGLKNKLTGKILEAKLALQDMLAFRSLLEGRMAFSYIIEFMSERKNMVGSHKEAWIDAHDKLTSGLSIERSFSHPFFSTIFRYYIVRIYNTNETTEACDEAIEFYIDEIDRVMDKFSSVMNKVGLFSAIVVLLMILLGLYFPMLQMGQGGIKV